MSALNEIVMLRAKAAAHAKVPLLVLMVVLGVQVVGGAVALPTYFVMRWFCGPSEGLAIMCWLLFLAGAIFGAIPLVDSAKALHEARCRIADLESKLGDE